MARRRASKSRRKHTYLETEDRARLVRLAEEIDGRTAELARIMARNVGASPKWPLVRYAMQHHPGDSSDMVVVMHEVTFTDGSKMCHDGKKGVTCSGPCPC